MSTPCDIDILIIKFYIASRRYFGRYLRGIAGLSLSIKARQRINSELCVFASRLFGPDVKYSPRIIRNLLTVIRDRGFWDNL